MSSLLPPSRLPSRGNLLLRIQESILSMTVRWGASGGRGDEWEPDRSAPPQASRIFINLSMASYIYQSSVAPQDVDKSFNNFHTTNFQISALNLTGLGGICVCVPLNTVCIRGGRVDHFLQPHDWLHPAWIFRLKSPGHSHSTMTYCAHAPCVPLSRRLHTTALVVVLGIGWGTWPP